MVACRRVLRVRAGPVIALLAATLGLAAPGAFADPSTYALDYVQKAYVAYYGRPADPAGQAYWAAQMDAAGGSLGAIIDAFGNSSEFNRRYGGLGNAALVTLIYQQALGRDPDPAGLAYYVGELQAGRRTLQSITLDVLNGATTAPDATVVANKLAIAAYFTAKVTAGCAYGTEQDGVLLLSGVTANSATVYATRALADSRCRGAAAARLGTAVEYYHRNLRHYLVTAYPDEVAALDADTTTAGWSRTGGEFHVYLDPAPGAQAVCRFSRMSGAGPFAYLFTADPGECAALKAQPSLNYDGVAFHLATPAGGQCATGWPVYRSSYDNGSAANHRLTVDLTAHVRMPARRGDVAQGVAMCAPITDAEREADVVRFLEQATLGPTEALVQEVMAKGIAAWLDEQIAMNVTRYTQRPYFDNVAEVATCINDMSLPWTPEKWCLVQKVSNLPVAWEFFRQAKAGPDQLRMRMAHAWHSIMAANNITYAVAEFQQRFRDHAFANYETLLSKYVLSPNLGDYQNWVLNIPEFNGIKPNENFARELMQLFTIGVNVLADDGTPVLDGQGRLIPTYGQADIEAMARVLTGYAYPTRPGFVPSWDRWDFDQNTYAYFVGDMIPFDQWHDKGAKSLLAGRLVLNPGGTAEGELRAALRMLVDHPNTPPFIVRQLIQKTVTSSPTPGYVARVAAVFKDNGKGVRGDLAAVTRAILLDPEARGARKIDPEYGRLREPVLFWTAMIRALDVLTDGHQPHANNYDSGQNLFSFPSVFGYYPADFTLVGTEVPAPEFGIFTSSEFLNRANQINNLLYNVDQPWSQGPYGWGPQGFVPNATGTPSPQLTAFLPDAGNADALVDRLDRLFLHGTMTPAMRKSIVVAVNKLPPSEALRRTKLAINLALTSIAYQVQK